MKAHGPFRISGVGTGALGSALNRERPVRFRFDRTPLVGYAGDTLASALLANGKRTLARSFKFRRPRGVYSCGIEEPNALVQLESAHRTTPSARSTLIDLYEGLEAFSCAGWPSLRLDLGRVLDFTPALWAAGFYNKTFIWPSWHAYEWLVRRMGGAGRAPVGADPDRYDVRNLHCEVLVIGAGVAGLRAARAAAETGQRVVLADQAAELGGRCAWDGSPVDGMSGAMWTRTAAEQLAHFGELQILRRTIAVGYYERGVVTLLENVPTDRVRRGAPRERYWIVRANRVVMATGAIEQPLVFCNNDRPGVLLAGAAHQYLRRFAVAAGRRVLIATNNDSAYALARDLRAAGVHLLAVADTRREVPQPVIDEMRTLNVTVLTGSIPVDTGGFSALSSVSIGRLSADSTRVTSVERYACDSLAISGGWNPALHLYSQAGGQLVYREGSGAFEALRDPPLVTLTGAAAGATDVSPASPASLGIRVSPVGNTRRQWVDLRHDVTVADLELALRENLSSMEHVKRYTTTGMALDQGKTSSAVTLEIVARLRGKPPAELSHTTLRPPFVPVTLGAIAGRGVGERFAPYRVLPMHDWHAQNGVVLEDFGEWKRPAVYLRPGELRHEATIREARAVRNAVGLFDASPLGKIEIEGPDGLEFLDRFYINNLMTLKPGQVRYGLMLRESGVIFDDGTVAMLAADRLVITTTSGNAGRVSAWLEEWHQCEWPHLRVAISAVTDQWATVMLAGPRAREVLSTLNSGVDLSATAFPHMRMREGRFTGRSARIYRVSFTGELSYEINVPAGAGQDLWDALLAAGQPHGLQPFGVNALLLMRLEKGYMHVGTDTDGTTVPDDVGWGKVAASKGADFVGKRSLALPENVRPDRLQLIGLTGQEDIGVGTHLRVRGSAEATDGWVTSAGRMVQTDEPIALALLRGGRRQIGSDVTVHDARNVTLAKVVNAPFFDPAGERLHA